MCIVLLTTAHRDYALIIIDNRDEYILRPTSRPHWWKLPNGTDVLSSRDLQRAEKGTWLGITKQGVFAVLTNYRETDIHDATHPIHGTRSRGGMVTRWLSSDTKATIAESVHDMVKDGGVKGVGGFSMVCGKLKVTREGNLDRIAIVSNRNDHVDQVPWIGHCRGEVCGLSNTCFDDENKWPKLENGKRMLRDAIDEVVGQGLGEEELVQRLYGILDADTLPRHASMNLEDYVAELKHSIFIPAIGDAKHEKAMEEARAKGKGQWAADDQKAAEEEMAAEGIVDPSNLGFETGMYGTQRQTIILIGWDGQVSYRERALFDANGNPIPRGDGDVLFRFAMEGWEQ
jgi:uncharacterized protein with NRDE domain